MAHFNTATLEVRNLNEDMTILAMKKDLKGFRFIDSLDKTLLRTYAKFLKHVYKYIRMDEATSDRCQIDEESQKKKQKKRSNQVG